MMMFITLTLLISSNDYNHDNHHSNDNNSNSTPSPPTKSFPTKSP